MLNVLLKKQLLELKYSYFKDRKTGKLKSKKAIIGYSVLYFFLYGCFAFSIFAITMFLKMYIPDVKNVWMICSMMAFLTIFLSTFINMLITRGILYDAKDNDFLLSLPIEDKYIILSRMFHVIINSLIYTSILWIPTIVHCIIFCGFSLLIILYGLLSLILLTLLVSVLSCLFGHLIASLTRKSKKKNIVTTVLTLVLLGLYYFIYFNANKFMTALLADIDKFSNFLQREGFILSIIGKAVSGDSVSMLLSTGVYLLICIIGFMFILPNYRKQLVVSPSFSKKEFKGNYSKQISVKKALFNREVKLFFSNSTYTLNDGLGAVILCVGAVLLIVFKSKIDELLVFLEIIPEIKEILPVILVFTILMIVGMDALSVPAVSLEGKNYWIVRSLPVSTYDVLNSKRLLQYRMHVFPALLLAMVSTFVFDLEDSLSISIMLFAVITGVTFITYVDLFLGIKGASLKWTDPTTVIKGGGSLLIALFGDMLLFPCLALLYVFVVKKYISSNMFIVCFILICIVLTFVLDKWVSSKGVRHFEELG